MFKKNKDEQFITNTDNTVAFNTKPARSSRTSRFRESLYQSKNSMTVQSMYFHVVLPDKPQYYVEDMKNPDDAAEVNDWIAENTVDFLNELQLIYGILVEGNENWKMLCDDAHKDPKVGYPKNIQYKWKTSNHTKPKLLPVDSYVEHVLFWNFAQVEDESIFPTDEEDDFPPNFLVHAKKMFQRMFRIFAVILSNSCLHQRKDVESSLPSCFRHFMFFAWKWNLLEAREYSSTIPLHTKVLKDKFDRDEQLYLKGKLKKEE